PAALEPERLRRPAIVTASPVTDSRSPEIPSNIWAWPTVLQGSPLADYRAPPRRPVMSFNTTSWRALSALFVVAPLAIASAQSNATPPATASTAAAPAVKMSGGKKVLTLDDYGKWNRIASTGISDDGAWMTYAYQPNDGDATLYIKQIDGDKLYTVPVGSAP